MAIILTQLRQASMPSARMLTYILSFLPLSDQKEDCLMSQAWYCAVQNALREAKVQYNIPVSPAFLPAIKRLGLRGISCISLANLDASPASNQVLQPVAYHLGPHLESLCLSGGSPTEASFVALILGCPALHILDLSGFNSLFTSGMLLAQPETTQQVQQALSGLHELNLAGLTWLTSASTGSAAVPQAWSASPWPTVTSPLSLAQLGQHWLPGLLHLPTFFPYVLRFVKRQGGRLRALDRSGTGLLLEALPALGQVAGLQLQELNLHSCQDLSTEAVAIPCHQQPGLISLDLSSCSELADRVLLAVSRGLQHLQRLSLRKLQQLTDGGCTALGDLWELQSLNMAECCLVQGQELAQALSPEHGAPPPLVSLNLAYCSSLKDASLLSLIPSLGASLRVLDLSSCVALTNKIVQAICTYLTHLSVLHLAWCKEIQDWGLLGLGEPREESAQGRQV
ncbi:LOW QUALITY PROTEIN: hypothetical protein MC885_015644 [Smutsia gigantea]|nr:LOW QUALITY PROTEIN: hypothetical protein MC885_015644 [Smutsia gigantea]